VFLRWLLYSCKGDTNNCSKSALELKMFFFKASSAVYTDFEEALCRTAICTWLSCGFRSVVKHYNNRNYGILLNFWACCKINKFANKHTKNSGNKYCKASAPFFKCTDLVWKTKILKSRETVPFDIFCNNVHIGKHTGVGSLCRS
jgi:hypothetical protein